MPSSVIASDIAKFFRTGDFATSVTVNGASVDAIITRRYTSFGEGSAEGETQTVALRVPSSAGVAHDDAVVADGVSYVVTHIETAEGVDTVLLRTA